MTKKKTLAEIAEHWKNDKKLYVKKSTFSAYMLLLENHLLPVFKNHSEIEEKDVQKFVFQKLEQGLSQKSIKDILIVLKMVLKFGAKNKWIEFINFDIQYPTVRETHTIEVLSRTHQKKVMSYIQEHFTFRNLGVYICLCSGMRIGEICALTWEDIDTDNGIINIRKTIQRIYVIVREIPITRELLRMLKPFKKIVNPAFYVLTNDSKPTEPRTYRSYYKNLMRYLEIPDIKFHGLRHSFATRCIESNCDYKTVSVLLGHSNISTTLNLYVHPNLEQKKKAIDQMFKALK